MKKIIRRSFYVAVLLVAVALPLPAAWESIGAVTASAPEANQITFSSSQAEVTVTVLAPDLVRVRMTRGTPGPDYSSAVVKTDWQQTSVHFSGAKDASIIRTSELEILAQLSPFTLAF